MPADALLGFERAPAAKYGASVCAVAPLAALAFVRNIGAGLVVFTGWSNYAIGVAVL
ncbi:hypothetical protein GCM10009416_29810 [Craurococcus roseus]|uniref:Uncharacterized protein n=1 Tax=Craurococcus roseus TaxID=77585 RepID=A0ABN1FF52_9PROT